MSSRNVRWARWTLSSSVFWVAVLFVASLFLMPTLRPFFELAFPGVEPAVYNRSSFLKLWWSQATLVGISSLVSSVAGVTLAIAVTRPRGREFRTLVNTVASIGQTFPPVAVLAIAVPIIGFGGPPVLIALILYGFLPIVASAIAGLENIAPDVLDAARGMGMSSWQILRSVELPLAAPMMLSGIRTSVTVNIGTATIGSTVGALTLGTPIINGLVAEKLPFVIQGTIVVGLFAILVDLIFERVDERLRGRYP